ncbi:hypothetical protein NQ318_002470 [Aromia moschata]|uniref:DUF913 domain-containing protein n=1 Tax=Aromia moschata TaxID=1265417 RepID=A0AAV8Y6J9_9CUCU|nr:hypothetical protein NQ318_002470 [Aromia moschata]
MMESLLQVINWQGFELDHITFVTRAVRVIDLITNIDMQAFQIHGGPTQLYKSIGQRTAVPDKDSEHAFDENTPGPSTAENAEEETITSVDLEDVAENAGKTCLPQRAALLKSMLNFLKKAFQDSAFAESIRHLMEGTLPNSLKNIIAALCLNTRGLESFAKCKPFEKLFNILLSPNYLPAMREKT